MREDKIIEELRKNDSCKPRIRKIARKIGIPPSTLHNKLKKLEEKGVIKGYRGMIDDQKVGEVNGFLFIKIKLGTDVEEAARKLSEYQSIVELRSIVGEWYFIARVRAKDMNEYNDIIRNFVKLEFLMAVEDTLCTETYKKEF